MLVVCCMVFLPLRNLVLTSTYGNRVHPVTGKYAFHAGVDLRANRDTVYAILDGRVTHTGYHDALGVHIILQHGEVQSVYGHLSGVFVFPGDSILAGSPIGITGATGRVTGEHLHFAVKYRDQFINPIKFLYQLLKSNYYEQ